MRRHGKSAVRRVQLVESVMRGALIRAAAKRAHELVSTLPWAMPPRRRYDYLELRCRPLCNEGDTITIDGVLYVVEKLYESGRGSFVMNVRERI